MTTLQIVGRSSSLFTRMPLIFAEELVERATRRLDAESLVIALKPVVVGRDPLQQLQVARVTAECLDLTLLLSEAVRQQTAAFR